MQKFTKKLTLILSALFVKTMLFAAPVTIEDTKYVATILQDGQMEILYSITFTENETRNKIRSIGQFIEPMSIIESWGTTGKNRFGVTMTKNSYGYYAANFSITTSQTKKYTVNIRYKLSKSMFTDTTFKNKPYGAFWWPTVQWDLPISYNFV